MRNATLYVTSATQRDLGTAAQLLGLPSGEDLAEVWLRERLDAMPEIKELQGKISYAVKSAREKFFAAHPSLSPSPAASARAAIKDAQS